MGNSAYPEGFIYNVPRESLNRWREPGDNVHIQRFTETTNQQAYNVWVNLFRNSSGVYSNASYVRLKNISVSYTLDEKLSRRIKLSSCRIYLTGQNLFTLTNYKAGDPETQNYLRLPPLKTFVGGIQFTF